MSARCSVDELDRSSRRHGLITVTADELAGGDTKCRSGVSWGRQNEMAQGFIHCQWVLHRNDPPEMILDIFVYGGPVRGSDLRHEDGGPRGRSDIRRRWDEVRLEELGAC